MKRLIYVLPIMISMVVIALFVGRNLASEQRVAAAPLSYDVSLYSEEEWLKICRDAVRTMGMVGEPIHEEWALMTRGSYLTLVGKSGSAEGRDEPLFVYLAFGDIPELMMVGFGLDGPVKDLGGIKLLFDAKTGTSGSLEVFPKGAKSGADVGVDLSFIPADAGPVAVSHPPPTLVP